MINDLCGYSCYVDYGWSYWHWSTAVSTYLSFLTDHVDPWPSLPQLWLLPRCWSSRCFPASLVFCQPCFRLLKSFDRGNGARRFVIRGHGRVAPWWKCQNCKERMANGSRICSGDITKHAQNHEKYKDACLTLSDITCSGILRTMENADVAEVNHQQLSSVR